MATKWSYDKLGDEYDKLCQKYLAETVSGCTSITWFVHYMDCLMLFFKAGWTEEEFDTELERRLIEKDNK